MNAKQMLLDYAAKHNDRKVYTDEQWLGKAMTEGIVINRSGSDRTVCNIRREAKTIIVTETLVEKTDLIVDGRMTDGPNKETVNEIFRVNL